jgi:putative membrane protein
MVQHMLLVVVAGPLLAWSRPLATSLRAVPLSWRKASGSWRRRAGLTPVRTAWLYHPVPPWLALAGSVWLWHSSFMYGLALRYEAAHVLEHAMFLVSAVWFWNIALGGLRRPPRAVGTSVLMLFTIALQGVLLSAMLTFSEYPWYREYLDTAPRWGLTPLEDQQLAGLIMWIPGGLVYTGAALAVIYRWIGTGEEADMGETGVPDPIYPS